MYMLQVQRASSAFSWQKTRLESTAKEGNDVCVFQTCPLNPERANYRKKCLVLTGSTVCTAHVSEMHVAVSAGAHLQSIALCSAQTEMKPVLVKPLLWFIRYTGTNLDRACMVLLLQVPLKFSMRTVPERWGTSHS